MIVLDLVEKVVREFLVAALPLPVAAFLSIPVIVLVVLAGATLVVRKLLVPFCRVVLTVLGWAAVGVGAVVLLPEAAIASGFRQASRRPPAAIYSIGDAVAAGVSGLRRAVDNAAGPVGRLARTNIVVIILAVAAWIWWWNATHCTDAAVQAATCTRPITAWWTFVTR